MDQARGDRYALGGALSVATAELLRLVHRAAGGPVDDVASLTPQRRALVVAAVRARSAAAACSALVARLLILDRESARKQMHEVGRPDFVEPGVTTLEGIEPYVWQASLRAVKAARAEVAVAVEHWQGWDGSSAQEIEQQLVQLLGYVDDLTALLEAQEAAATSVNGHSQSSAVRTLERDADDADTVPAAEG